MIQIQYTVVIKMCNTGVYSCGPFTTEEAAKQFACDVAFGDVNAFETERKTIVMISSLPESIEIVPSFIAIKED